MVDQAPREFERALLCFVRSLELSGCAVNEGVPVACPACDALSLFFVRRPRCEGSDYGEEPIPRDPTIAAHSPSQPLRPTCVRCGSLLSIASPVPSHDPLQRTACASSVTSSIMEELPRPPPPLPIPLRQRSSDKHELRCDTADSVVAAAPREVVQVASTVSSLHEQERRDVVASAVPLVAPVESLLSRRDAEAIADLVASMRALDAAVDAAEAFLDGGSPSQLWASQPSL